MEDEHNNLNPLPSDESTENLSQNEENKIINHPVEEQAGEEREITEDFSVQGTTEEIEFNEPVKPGTTLNSSDDNAISASAGFVEISDLDLIDLPQSVQEDIKLNDIDVKQNDLPVWLQEMISESEDEQNDDPKPIIDEAAQNVELAEATDWEKEHTDSEFITEDQSIENPNDLSEENIVSITELADEDTTPISIKTIDKESLEVPIFEPNILVISDTDKKFNEVEQLLSHGEYQLAISILKSLAVEAEDYERIAPLVSQLTEHDGKNDHHVWEFSGDIALKQNQPAKAVNAYAKAICVLLTNHKGHNETP